MHNKKIENYDTNNVKQQANFKNEWQLASNSYGSWNMYKTQKCNLNMQAEVSDLKPKTSDTEKQITEVILPKPQITTSDETCSYLKQNDMLNINEKSKQEQISCECSSIELNDFENEINGEAEIELEDIIAVAAADDEDNNTCNCTEDAQLNCLEKHVYDTIDNMSGYEDDIIEL